ncbi:MAG TPA: tetratricopeptide repeat protein [Lysobacter sp.]|nr:tetratricopeptide repeat protein [Lysobacter sp.]
MTVLLLLALLAACASPGHPRTPRSYQRLLGEADAAMTLGQVDLAVAALEQAAQADPTRKEPWLRLARAHALAERHGAVAQAAEEALRRDPDDAEARALLTTSSLRLAAAALERGRRDKWAAPAPGDLDRLVQALRAGAPADALVPDAVRQELAALRARAEKPTRCEPAKRAPKPAGDPFRVLGGDDDGK